MAKTYYKVVMPHPETKELLSAVSAALPDKWVTTYKPGEWTEAPNDSGLFVFETLGMAEAFQGGFAGLRRAIWECECKDPVEAPKFVPSPSRFAQDNHETFQRFWEGQESRQDQLYMLPTPTATAFFKQVRLTKHIEEVLR